MNIYTITIVLIIERKGCDIGRGTIARKNGIVNVGSMFPEKEAQINSSHKITIFSPMLFALIWKIDETKIMCFNISRLFMYYYNY